MQIFIITLSLTAWTFTRGALSHSRVKNDHQEHHHTMKGAVEQLSSAFSRGHFSSKHCCINNTVAFKLSILSKSLI